MANLEITRPLTAAQAEVLDDGARRFLAELHRRFNAQRLNLLARRTARAANSGPLSERM